MWLVRGVVADGNRQLRRRKMVPVCSHDLPGSITRFLVNQSAQRLSALPPPPVLDKQVERRLLLFVRRCPAGADDHIRQRPEIARWPRNTRVSVTARLK